MAIRPEDLSITKQIELEFIFSGMAAAMQRCFNMNDPSQIAPVMEGPLGHAIVETLADLKKQS